MGRKVHLTIGLDFAILYASHPTGLMSKAED